MLFGTPLRLLHEVIHRALQPIVLSGSAVISARERDIKWEAADELLREMPERSLAVQLAHLEARISACEKGTTLGMPPWVAGGGCRIEHSSRSCSFTVL